MSEKQHSTEVQDELDLVQRCKLKDEQAWRQLVYSRGPNVQTWIARSRLPTADQEHIFQDVWLTVAIKIEQFHGQRFSGWLFTITRSRLLDYLRRNKRDPLSKSESLFMRDVEADDKPIFEHHDGFCGFKVNSDPRYVTLHAAAHAIYASVGPQSWKAFWRTAIDGLSAIEVADELSMSPSAVRMAKSRILARFRKMLAP